MVWQSKILRLPKFEIDCLKNEKDIIDQRVPTLLWSTIVAHYGNESAMLVIEKKQIFSIEKKNDFCRHKILAILIISERLTAGITEHRTVTKLASISFKWT